MNPALEVTGARVRLGQVEALRGASLTVRPGEVVGLVGPNGAGKTTLLRAALGLVRLEAGSARLGGREVAALADLQRAALAAYLPQERRVGWNLPAWRIASLGAASRPPARAREAAMQALARVGMTDQAHRGVLDLSGGERARVLFARLLAAGAPLLAADEPAAGLDPDAQLLALELLREEAQAGRAVVATLHDLALAARACDRLVVIAGGATVADGPPWQALSPGVLAEVFGLEGELIATERGPVLASRRLPHRVA
ncbi:ABC transporter ATP-binding protein [Phenylobacterium sp.]|jgi:iron complex transport system ATP-binding protein|uniref:ABC transporter ATP-binding protein n=1 Tax=Phenylobacterium sp. TaxID=1871053 RepID=UPI002E348DBC|nr:ABC transporter ATP-binding protein [Phenylobacterium sp.]HEX2560464.1 ABC transporter ATP-binding protein [Phenylobacterium sp.]